MKIITKSKRVPVGFECDLYEASFGIPDAGDAFYIEEAAHLNGGNGDFLVSELEFSYKGKPIKLEDIKVRWEQKEQETKK